MAEKNREQQVEAVEPKKVDAEVKKAETAKPKTAPIAFNLEPNDQHVYNNPDTGVAVYVRGGNYVVVKGESVVATRPVETSGDPQTFVSTNLDDVLKAA